MKFYIHKCRVCKKYTLEEVHCGTDTACPHPTKFSPEDKYSEYRIKRKG